MELVLQNIGEAAPQIGYVRPAKLSVADYHSMLHAGLLAEGNSIELLDGYLVEKMSKNPPHSAINSRLAARLIRLLSADWSVRSQEPITLQESEPEPDLVVARGGDSNYLKRHPHPAEVALVVEIADTSLERDRVWKLEIYARAGIPVYWLVDVAAQAVEVYDDPAAGTYRRKSILTSGAVLSLAEPPLQLPLANLFV